MIKSRIKIKRVGTPLAFGDFTACPANHVSKRFTGWMPARGALPTRLNE